MSNCASCFFLQCPVLIVWGDKDPWEPIELGRGFINFDSVEDFVTLPNVGHCPQVSLSLFLSQSAHTHSQAYAPAHCACVASALSVVLVLHFLDILDFIVQKIALNCANLDCTWEFKNIVSCVFLDWNITIREHVLAFLKKQQSHYATMDGSLCGFLC